MSDDSDATGEENPTRESGVEFGELETKLERHDYPTTGDDILSAYGDHEIQMERGSETLREILGPLGDDGQVQEYDSTEEVQQAIYTMVGAEAVGRRHYSDRGGAPIGDESSDEIDDESF
jgi:hypothetical protein